MKIYRYYGEKNMAYGNEKLKVLKAWNNNKLEQIIKLGISYHDDDYVDSFMASFDYNGNIEVDAEISGKTKLFSHPVLVTNMNLVIAEIVEWIITSERGAT